jgi:glucose-6-phosphate 1-dehydrogenase
MAAPQSDAFVFFGATGDLAYKKIFPTLQALIKRGRLDAPIIGVAGRPWSVEQLRDRARESLEEHGGVDQAAFEKLSARLQYISGDYGGTEIYDQLRQAIGDAKYPLHYLAIPPSLFAAVVEGLDKSGCAKNARVVVEKPFGRDLATAKELNQILQSVFPESSIFRIDHYLGKEAVQNLLYTRFTNSILEPIWNRTYVDSVQITMAEKFGVEGRGKFYEEVGAIRDVVQNHMLQVTACLAMDAPTGEENEAVRDEKARLLKAVQPFDPANIIRGQFRGYRNESGVAPDSQVETFAAVKFYIDTWRWAGVPFYIRVGKSLSTTTNEVLVRLKRPPRDVFGDSYTGDPNYFYFRLSPTVLTALGMRSKRAGEAMAGTEVGLVAQTDPGDQMEPYERLLGDAMRGDATLFARQDEVEAEWRIVNPILDNATPIHEYEPHSWGPPEADKLIAESGGWHNPLSDG